MDDRQRQITEGAGLQESRLNQDFIDWLQRWGTPILLVVCLIAVAYTANTWWKRTKATRYDEAYVQLNAAMTAGSPDGLLRVAREHAGQGAVAAMATLAAADAFLRTSVTGVVPGGDPAKEDDVLNDDEIRANLQRARDLYNDALRAVGSDRSKVLLALQARMGIASAQIGLGDVDAAKRTLGELAASARQAGHEAFATMAEERAALLDRVNLSAQLPTQDDVRPSMRPAPMVIDDMGFAPMLSPSGDIFGPTPGAPGPDAPPSNPNWTPAPTPDPDDDGR